MQCFDASAMDFSLLRTRTCSCTCPAAAYTHVESYYRLACRSVSLSAPGRVFAARTFLGVVLAAPIDCATCVASSGWMPCARAAAAALMGVWGRPSCPGRLLRARQSPSRLASLAPVPIPPVPLARHWWSACCTSLLLLLLLSEDTAAASQLSPKSRRVTARDGRSAPAAPRAAATVLIFGGAEAEPACRCWRAAKRCRAASRSSRTTSSGIYTLNSSGLRRQTTLGAVSLKADDAVMAAMREIGGAATAISQYIHRTSFRLRRGSTLTFVYADGDL